MADCNYPLDMSIISQYLNQYTGNVCCWQPATLTYADFLTGITNTYNNSCLEDKTISDYITTLFTYCLSGSSGGGGTSYWSANTDGSITPSGFSTSIGIGTNTPTGLFEVKDYISFKTSDQTTLIGYNAGQNWEATSDGNTMIGQAAGGVGTWNDANYNTAVGYNTMAFLTEGDNNTAVGHQSIATLTTGSNNTAMGYQAAYSQTTDSKNTVFGSEAHTQPHILGDGGTDAENVAIGYQSMYLPNRGYKNVAVGSESLKGNSIWDTGSQGSVAVGYRALYASRTGDYNVAIGYQAGDNITTGDYNISIGPDADPPSATDSYQMNIGNIIYGIDVGSSNSINTIGIGTATPNEPLTVVGDISGTTDLHIDNNIYFGSLSGGTF